jgi:hypothetical protein
MQQQYPPPGQQPYPGGGNYPHMETMVRTYGEDKPELVQQLFAADAATMSNSGWVVQSQNYISNDRGPGLTVLWIILGFFLIIPWLFIPFSLPKKRGVLTVTYQRRR